MQPACVRASIPSKLAKVDFKIQLPHGTLGLQLRDKGGRSAGVPRDGTTVSAGLGAACPRHKSVISHEHLF